MSVLANVDESAYVIGILAGNNKRTRREILEVFSGERKRIAGRKIVCVCPCIVRCGGLYLYSEYYRNCMLYVHKLVNYYYFSVPIEIAASGTRDRPLPPALQPAKSSAEQHFPTLPHSFTLQPLSNSSHLLTITTLIPPPHPPKTSSYSLSLIITFAPSLAPPFRAITLRDLSISLILRLL